MGVGTLLRGLLDDAVDVLNMTHYSPRLREVIRPEKQSSGPLRGAERYLDAAGMYPKQSYWGVDVGKPGGYNPEFRVGVFRHETRLPAEGFYDIALDPLGLRKEAEDIVNRQRAASTERMADSYWENRTINYQMRLAKQRGFIGLLNRDHPGGAIATTFYPAQPLWAGQATDESRLRGVMDYLEGLR